MSDPDPLPFAADFPPATRGDWQKLVDAVLKGAPFEELVGATYDGLRVEPLAARRSDAEPVTARAGATPWQVLARVDHPDPAAANAQALDDLANGATGLVLVFAGALGSYGFGLEAAPAALARALDGVRFDAGISLDLDLPPFAREVPQRVADQIRQAVDPAASNVRFGYDPLTAAVMTGKLALPWNETAPLFGRLIGTLVQAGFKGPFAVGDGRAVHNAGGSEAQELAFALACAVAYLRALDAGGMALAAARGAIYFRLAADADQFLTMAKFRALRRLWARVEEACGLAVKPAFVTAETAWRMMTQRDPHVNMLRTAIAVCAAALGGADAISVLPFTAARGLPDALARRNARNTQLILLEEAHLDKVADPGAGAGTVEELTDQLCGAAWTLFQEIEAAGGAAAAITDGLIQRKVAAVRAKRIDAAANLKDAVTGVSAFPNLHEAAVEVLAPMPQRHGPAAEPSFEPMPVIRIAEPFERLRGASDRQLAVAGSRPRIFLATLGTPADFAARASFAGNFFEAGGIETVSRDDGDLSSLVAAFKKAATPLACLCSSDKVYEQDAAAAAEALKAAGAKLIYLAGRATELQAALREAGVQSFIYAGCDALATLQAAYDILRIER